jgi:hypothetical protein
MQRFTPKRIAGKVVRTLTGKPPDNLVSRTNRVLLERGVLATPLTPADLWAITDIHVQNDRGISIEEIRNWRPDWALVSQRSYGFFGHLWSSLRTEYRKREEDLIAARELSGFHIGAVWQNRCNTPK